MIEAKEYICETPQRLDLFLTQEIGQTRSQIAHLIKQKCVFINNKIVSRPGVKLKENQKIRVEFPEAKKKRP